MKFSALIKTVSLIVCCMAFQTNAGVIFYENFENGWNGWSTDNGVWSIGHPTIGPESGYDSNNCATTGLDANFPPWTSSRLISPIVELPEVSGSEHIEIRFHEWYSYPMTGYWPCSPGGSVHISEWINDLEGWGPWTDLGQHTEPRDSEGWYPVSVDITLYAGKKVRIGFWHQGCETVGPGWYIDNVEVWKGVPTWDGSKETFENGWGNWYTDLGFWHIGHPTIGPENGYDSNNCATTGLDANFPPWTSSRLISPIVELPDISGSERIEIRFQEWYFYPTTGYYPCPSAGNVHISEWTTSGWSGWVDLGQYTEQRNSAGWYPVSVDITLYAGKKIRIGFWHQGCEVEGPGWYIDDVEVVHCITTQMGDFTWDGQVDGADLELFASQWLQSSFYQLCDIAPAPGGDGIVDFLDFAILAKYWRKDCSMVMAEDDSMDMVWVSINDPGVPEHEGFNGQMSKYETTNSQYCQFLNAAKATGDINVSDTNVYGADGNNGGEDFVGQVYYNLAGQGESYNGATNGGAARIHYSGGVFSVDSGFENHPVTYVSWYGATAFCNYYGYRLPTHWEWRAVADCEGSYTYGCGTSINNSIANYYDSAHPYGTTEVGAFGTYGYGMCDMAGNVQELVTHSIDFCAMRTGGGWRDSYDDCTVSSWQELYPDFTSNIIGFRVCR